MEYEPNFLSQPQNETQQVELNKVKLNRRWVFWENYESKTGEKLEWSKSIKQIFSFNEIISFWEFWNNYPGSNIANIFYNGERLR